ncbi:hypothetical protein HU200_000508 [Digitaria exilis]|uniref:DYW domain-containing protein n=1 Tax=Digitaria exilis TaxID=1010633 RepID=A0A835KVK5_9POAL|nr:hypothetical protein HU200_000508 [Digitaria exilis]
MLAEAEEWGEAIAVFAEMQARGVPTDGYACGSAGRARAPAHARVPPSSPACTPRTQRWPRPRGCSRVETTEAPAVAWNAMLACWLLRAARARGRRHDALELAGRMARSGPEPSLSALGDMEVGTPCCPAARGTVATGKHLALFGACWNKGCCRIPAQCRAFSRYANTGQFDNALKLVDEMKRNRLDPANYLQMVSLYEHEQMFDEAESLKYEMKARALDTRPGWSWIQIEQSIHVFEVEGKPHPDTAEIYEELIRLVFQIRKAGYVPDTNCIADNVPEEEEKLLLSHTEKLAITYGLIHSSASRVPIRVIKNTRMCNDYHDHEVAKRISALCDRQIILRDADMFHHFTCGDWSCNDSLVNNE